jgi:hypothetical protein
VTSSAAGRPLSRPLFVGFAVASIGGPLAVVALLGPNAVGGRAIGSAGLAAVLGVAMFAPPLWVWWRYSGEIASAGGLYAFVQAAAGVRAARLHGAIWVVSYFLYLPYTVTLIVYDLLPAGFPGLVPYRGWMQALMPIAIAALVVWAELGAFRLLAGVAAIQVAVLIAFAAVLVHGAGTRLSAFALNSSGGQLPRGAANVALLFVCASLPLYLGGEVVGGARTVRRTLVGSVAAVAVLVVAGLFGYAALAGLPVATLPAPGYTIARAYAGASFAAVVLAASVASVAALIVAEYVALTRLLHAMLRLPVRRSAVMIAVLFIAADVISLVDPTRIYQHALTASLVALYVSQAIVFAVFPLYARRHRPKHAAIDLMAAAAATGLMGFGLYVAISQAPT